MGGGGTTSATIPWQLSGLFQDTAKNMQELQKYYWSGLEGAWGYPTTPVTDPRGGKVPTDPGPDPSPAGKSGGADQLPADSVPANDSSVPVKADVDDPIETNQLPGWLDWDPETNSYGTAVNPPRTIGRGSTAGGLAPEGYSGQFNLETVLGFNPLATPGMSGMQQLVSQYIPRVIETPESELEAQRWAYRNLEESGDVPNDFGDWSLAGRTGYGDRMRNDLDQEWDPSTNPLWETAGFIPSVGDDWSGAVGTGTDSDLIEAPVGGPTGATAGPGGTSPGGSSGGLNGRLQAALNLFNKTTGESIKNEMESMGLGASQHLGNALEMGRASMIMPLMSEDMKYQADAANRRLALGQDVARQREDAIVRQAAQSEQGLGREERAIDRRTAARQAGMNLGMASSQNETNRWLEALNLGMKQGEVERGVGKEYAAAQKDELLRQQALAEQSLFGPLGGFLPSTMGSSTSK